MKNAVVSFLLCLIIFNTGGYFILFKQQQSQIRKEIKGKLKRAVPENELHEIQIGRENVSSIKWIDRNEFMLDGIMYDIVKTKIVDLHTVIYYCVNDTQETRLFANLDEMVNKGMDDKQNGTTSIKLIFNLLSSQLIQPQSYFFFTDQTQLSFAEPENFYCSPFLDMFVPPPEFC